METSAYCMACPNTNTIFHEQFTLYFIVPAPQQMPEGNLDIWLWYMYNQTSNKSNALFIFANLGLSCFYSSRSESCDYTRKPGTIVKQSWNTEPVDPVFTSGRGSSARRIPIIANTAVTSFSTGLYIGEKIKYNIFYNNAIHSPIF